ncbi:unnamed protein product [Fusarium fujikuroi]|nr:unnamed protein product [Fusarium fujikuroi]VTT76960.1 unnamed protein product [Fusarium fujikuroi]VZH89637.1 unnamed protein product [Fusarium fujikuroi]
MAGMSVVDSDQQESLRVAQTPSFCRLCNIELRGLGTWKAHVKSDGQDDFEDDDPESESDAEEDGIEEDQELVATKFVPGHCLFCSKDSSTLDESMKHMSLAHGFNTPFQEFLAVDLETLVSYLHFVINTYRECICCGTRRSTLEGIQHHMLAKGHCRLDITAETEEFYEIPQYEDALEYRKQDAGDPVRLPSGRVISHRKHEEPRVSRREVPDQKRVDSSAPVEPGMEIAHRRTVNGSREVVQASEAILAAQLSRLKITSDRAAQREEKRENIPPCSSFTLRALLKMSSSRSSSPDTASRADLQLRVDISANPNSPAYAPDMDDLQPVSFARLRDFSNWRDSEFLLYRCFTYAGDEVQMKEFILEDFEEMQKAMSALEDDHIHILNITSRSMFLLSSSELRELSQSLDLAPWITCGPEYNVLRGLGRRLYGSHYDLWFTLPLVDASMQEFTYPDQELHSLPVDSYKGVAHLSEDVGMLYLSFDKKTRQTRLLYSSAISARQKLASACQDAEELGVRDDPFTFITCALSSILQEQGITAHAISALISKMENYSNSLRFEIAENEETKVKETAIQLRKSLPYLEKILESANCTIQIIEDTISEHRDCRELLSIPSQHFLRVEKNLQTLRSQAISFKSYQDTRIRRINVCLSTLSSLLSLRTDNAIKANTEAMTRLTEANREDSGRMNDIAIATKLDSEAMITIAKLTMLYLPPTFIATLFSMGIFNFDFNDGKNGRLVMSSQWWMYIIFAIPLTLGTFYWFRAVTRSHKQASQKAEREAKQPE